MNRQFALQLYSCIPGIELCQVEHDDGKWWQWFVAGTDEPLSDPVRKHATAMRRMGKAMERAVRQDNQIDRRARLKPVLASRGIHDEPWGIIWGCDPGPECGTDVQIVDWLPGMREEVVLDGRTIAFCTPPKVDGRLDLRLKITNVLGGKWEAEWSDDVLWQNGAEVQFTERQGATDWMSIILLQGKYHMVPALDFT